MSLVGNHVEENLSVFTGIFISLLGFHCLQLWLYDFHDGIHSVLLHIA
jgi:hypothetical protein